MSQPVKQRKARLYLTSSGSTPYLEWIKGLKNKAVKAIIATRIQRAEHGNFGDSKGLGEGLQELRIKFGPGFRVHFGVDENNEIIIVLIGGDKSSQDKDIEKAQKYWADYKERTKEKEDGKKK